MSLQVSAFRSASNTMAQRLENLGVVQLQPIIDAIADSLRDRPFLIERDVAVTFLATEGRMLVSVRSAEPPSKRRLQPVTRGLDARQLRLVMATITNNIAEPISVSMLSSVAGLSRSHFSHAFRLTVGEAPHAHIVRMRVERAMKLMFETDASLCEIGLTTGFSDQAHFCNAFRRSVGTTPARWRKTHQFDRSGSEGRSEITRAHDFRD